MREIDHRFESVKLFLLIIFISRPNKGNYERGSGWIKIVNFCREY